MFLCNTITVCAFFQVFSISSTEQVIKVVQKDTFNSDLSPPSHTFERRTRAQTRERIERNSTFASDQVRFFRPPFHVYKLMYEPIEQG